MQDEVAKHTKKIYKAWNSTQHSLQEKVQEIAIEIFIIVFAVTLSIWLHSWSEHRHEQQEARKFLIELKEDLISDIKIFKEDKALATRLDNDFKFILSLKAKSANDSIVGSHTEIGLFSTNYNVGRYEGFKSSGKIGTIEDNSLKNNILAYYQQTIPNLLYRVNFINNEHIKILDATNDQPESLSLNEIFTSRKIKSMYNLLEFNYRYAISDYEQKIKQAEEIIREIDKISKE